MDIQYNNIIRLTRYLYIYDEVKLNLVVCMMLKKDFEEIIFWLSELYESGFHNELWELTYTMYYDFYAIYNQKLLSYIKKLHNKWKVNHSFEYFIKCYKNMYIKEVNSDIFYIRILSNQYSMLKKNERKFKLFLGRKPSICNKFETKYALCIRSFEKKHLNNIAYFMNEYDERLFCDLIYKYIDLKNQTENQNVYENKFKNIFKNNYYTNKKHIALVHLLTYNKKLKDKSVYVKETKKEIMFYKNINEEIYPVYKTLQHKMFYEVNNEIGEFQLSRDRIDFKTLQMLYWYHWDILCYHTPCWKKRFDEYNIQLVERNNKLELKYPNDDVYEEFWDKYNYEFDEQCLNVQKRVLKHLEFKKNNMKMIIMKMNY